MSLLRKLPIVVAGLMLANVGTWANGQETPSAKESEPKPAASDKTDPTVEKEIADAIANLRDHLVPTRQTFEQFEKLGAKAIKPLVKAIEENQGLAQPRGIQALGRMVVSDDEATAKGARAALESLVKSNQLNVSVQAQTMLKLEPAFRQEALLRKQAGQAQNNPGNAPLQIPFNGQNRTSRRISIANGSRKIEVSEGTTKIEIQDDNNGKNIKLKHSRDVDGKPKTDEYEAADLDELTKKHPEAAELYKKKIEEVKFPALPGIRRGGQQNQIQIQINGGVPAIPFDPAQRNRPVATLAPEPRTIQVGTSDGSIEITDKAGRDIKIKVTTTAQGESGVKEYAAEDLPTLARMHPEIAKLYQKYTGAVLK